MYSLANTILEGTRKEVKEVLKLGADVNELDEYGYTPLIEAAIVEKTSIAKLLVAEGAEINAQDVTGRTALHWAVETHNIPLCQFLLDHKADPNACTTNSEPVLVNAILRNQEDLKQLLYHYGASLQFAQDYINAKLIAHRFELRGKGEIINHQNAYLSLDYEGFVLEFTLGVICESLSSYLHNFSSRRLRRFFEAAQITVDCLQRAAKCIKYQHYTVEVTDHLESIHQLIDRDPIIIPVAYEGHAVTMVRVGKYFAKCDRGAASKRYGSVVMYEITNPSNYNLALIKFLMYKKQKKHFIEVGINELLGLKAITQLPIPSQISGNCSWANVEATIPTLMFMLWYRYTEQMDANRLISYKDAAMHFHKKWLEWDQNRAINQCINDFHSAKTDARKACKATLLAAVLFQHCDYNNPRDIKRAEKMLPILTEPKFDYILRSYIEVFHKKHPREQGKNLLSIIDICGFNIPY